MVGRGAHNDAVLSISTACSKTTLCGVVSLSARSSDQVISPKRDCKTMPRDTCQIKGRCAPTAAPTTLCTLRFGGIQTPYYRTAAPGDTQQQRTCIEQAMSGPSNPLLPKREPRSLLLLLLLLDTHIAPWIDASGLPWA